MKKSILLLTASAVILAGCNNTDEENLEDVEVSQEREKTNNELKYNHFNVEDETLNLKNGDYEAETTLTYADDVLLKQKTTTTAAYKSYGFKDKKDAEKKLIEEDEDLKKDQEGVSYDLELRDKDFTETIEIDYENADLSIVSNISEEDLEEGVYISYEQMKSTLFMRGYYTEGKSEANFTGQESIEGSGVIKREDNTVNYYDMDVVIPYEVQELTKDEAVKNFTPLQDYYKEMSKYDGIDLSITFEDEGMHFKQTVDYSKADVKNVFAIENIEEEPSEKDLERMREYGHQVDVFLRYGLLYEPEATEKE